MEAALKSRKGLSAFKGYGSARGSTAERERLEARMEEARKDGLNLRKLDTIGQEGYEEKVEEEARQQAEEEEEEESEDEDEEEEEEATPETEVVEEEEEETVSASFVEFVESVEAKKKEGNLAFSKACAASDGDEARILAMDAGIFYLDALDLLDKEATKEKRFTRSKELKELEERRLLIQLNRAAALNKQSEWKLSLRASNAALLIDKNNAKALYRRAIALAGLRKFADAEGDLNRLLALDATNKDAKRQLQKVTKEKLKYHDKKVQNVIRPTNDPNDNPAIANWGQTGASSLLSY